MVTETNKQRWFWWYNDKTGSCGASLHCKGDSVLAYDAEVEQKIFAINDVIDNLQRLGIISKSLSREQYRALWMHLLAVNNDEHLQSFYHHHVSDYCFDNDESECIDKYLAESVAIGSIDYNEKRDDVLARCVTIGGYQDVCFEVMKGDGQ